jgi:glycosyltransferase involved in cell wall biosynthesis
MLQAAALLQGNPNLHFEFVGSGPEREHMLALAGELGLKNVDFPGFLSSEELGQKIAGADLCLGIFGSTPQSYLTIQNKIYECLALGKPLVSGTSPLVARTFVHGRDLYLCERDPRSLAQAIATLSAAPDLRAALAQNGRSTFEASFSPAAIGRLFRDELEKWV